MDAPCRSISRTAQPSNVCVNWRWLPAIRRAAEERLHRVRRERAAGSLATELLQIGKRCADLPEVDRRTPDEILGYDDHGLPS